MNADVIHYGLRLLREDAKAFEAQGLPDSAARARAAADKIEKLMQAEVSREGAASAEVTR